MNQGARGRVSIIILNIGGLDPVVLPEMNKWIVRRRMVGWLFWI